MQGERKKLAGLLESQQTKFVKGEEDRKTSDRRHDMLQEFWEEDTPITSYLSSIARCLLPIAYYIYVYIYMYIYMY